MAPAKTWLSAIGLYLISSVAAKRLGAITLDRTHSNSPGRLSKFNKPASLVQIGKVGGVSRRQDEGCYGTCAECFGSNYRSCPDNENICWDPNDPTTGCNDITIPDFDDIDIPDFPDFDDIDIPGGTEWCTSGETCSECFGSGYELCPGSDNMCYDPDDPTTGCEDEGGFPDDDDIDIPGDTEWCTDGGSCSDCFGSGYELCPGSDLMCWDPSDPTSVCEDEDGLGGGDDDDDDSVDDDDLPTDSTDDEPTPPPTTPPPTSDEESTSPTPSGDSNDDDDNDDDGSGQDDVEVPDQDDDGSGQDDVEVPDQDDDGSAASRIGGMGILPIVAGAVGVVAFL